MFTSLYSHVPVRNRIWEKTDGAPFDELILSWNAERPRQGSYVFWVSVRINQIWTEWMRYAEWGASNQRTFDANQDTIVLDKPADGFRIRIESDAGFHFDKIHASLSRLSQFSILKPPSLPSVKLAVPFRSQMALDHPRHRQMCSPTSASIAIDALLHHAHTSATQLAEEVRDHGFDIYGNWIFNVAASYLRLQKKWECRVERLSGFAALHEKLLSGTPVVVSVKGPLPGAPLPYASGHLMVVRGWDAEKKRVLCADPAYATDAETEVSYPLDDFLEAWGRRRNLSYVFQRCV